MSQHCVPRAGVSASLKIWMSLISILGGSVFYCMAEIEGTLVGYVWLGVRHSHPNWHKTRTPFHG